MPKGYTANVQRNGVPFKTENHKQAVEEATTPADNIEIPSDSLEAFIKGYQLGKQE